MAKKAERQIARTYFVELGKTCTEISVLLSVSEVTLSKWRKEDKWDILRGAKLSNGNVRTDNITAIINDLSEERINLGNELKLAQANNNTEEVTRIRQQIAAVDDGVSKWNKTLESVTKEEGISIAMHIKVMEQLFNALRKYDEPIYLQTIEFQEYYVQQLLNG